MRTLNYDEVRVEKQAIIDSIKNGYVFIYPTDTIYGLGCNAQISSSVKKIRKIKSRSVSPFSVIVPSIKWVLDNCVVTKEGKQWLNKLPGPFTLIFKLKKKCVAKEVNPNLDTLGIRIPKHWIRNVVAEAGVPLVTTSVNISGEEYMTSMEDLDPQIKMAVDFLFYEGEKKGKPSKIVDLAGNSRIIER